MNVLFFTPSLYVRMILRAHPDEYDIDEIDDASLQEAEIVLGPRARRTLPYNSPAGMMTAMQLNPNASQANRGMSTTMTPSHIMLFKFREFIVFCRKDIHFTLNCKTFLHESLR